MEVIKLKKNEERKKTLRFYYIVVCYDVLLIYFGISGAHIIIINLEGIR